MKRLSPQPFSELQQYLHTQRGDLDHASCSSGLFGWPLPRAVLAEILPHGFRLTRGKSGKQ